LFSAMRVAASRSILSSSVPMASSRDGQEVVADR